jgi:DNA-binding response OmpR family regulator
MQKLTIAIVDDSPFMSRFLTIFLEKKYNVITFFDSQLALESIQNGLHLDALITDFDMPNLSGLDLIEAIREIDFNLPIAVISNSQESITRVQSFEAGANEFITKPFHPIELDLRIGNLLPNTILNYEAPVRSIFKQFVRAAAF